MNQIQFVEILKLIKTLERVVEQEREPLFRAIYDIWKPFADESNGEDDEFTFDRFKEILLLDGKLQTAFFLAALGLYCDPSWFNISSEEVLGAYANLSFPVIHRELLASVL